MEKKKREIIKVDTPKKSDVLVIRALITMALVVMIVFVVWFANPQNIGSPVIYWILTFALFFKLIKMLHEWYHYWSVSVPVLPGLSRQFTVDVLTTACPGEPRDMIIKTLKAMVAIRYPHTSYLCDEGDDPYLKDICAELGVIHVTRVEKIDAKAGNINNALRHAKGEICVVLDPDHVPVPEFLDRVLPYFQNPEIGFVQCVQAYGNQKESFIAKGAAEQTYHFYGPMMMCMNSYGTVQAIGANCTFRRTALDSIGGHAAGLSEDMHTAMQLHAKGWKSVYIPEILTRGLVPATLSSYYKQQLKWSRGTFELLFRTFPKLKNNFTWRQKLHYFTIPLYFLYGVINLIDILVPVLALTFATVPWEVNIGKFALLFAPLCGLSLIIRMYAQRWLLEKHERGFHFAGGILRTATWWIFLIGFVYTIFKIKVPYIPTPKEDEHRNYWGLSLPNVFAVVICAAAILYGLSIDWSPYSFAMAFYCFLNAAMLVFVSFISQQKLLNDLNSRIIKLPVAVHLIYSVKKFFNGAGNVVYGLVKAGPIALLIAGSLLFFSYSYVDEPENLNDPSFEKNLGGFYTGVEYESGNHLNQPNQITNKIISDISLTSVWIPFQTFQTSSVAGIINDIKRNGRMPFINWFAGRKGNALYDSIINGHCDTVLKSMANVLRNYHDAVFISFDPACDKNKSDAKKFVEAWQYVYSFLNNMGVSNATWTWCPEFATSNHYYPGEKFVDWLGVPVLNYGDNTLDDDWYSFAELYEPFRASYGLYEKPVMIRRFGCVNAAEQALWIGNAVKKIQTNYLEIHSVVFYEGKQSFKISSGVFISDFSLNQSSISEFASAIVDTRLSESPFSRTLLSYVKPNSSYASPFVSGKSGDFNLIDRGKPFYIRGIAYNTAHDWRDGNMPLTRRQLERDFSLIKQMGCNTIRRYDEGIYDRNILNLSDEYGLKILFGFWFDPKIDYYRDSSKVKEYIANVEEKVKKYRDHPSVLAWSVGNETWGLLKHRYAKPYLTKVRDHYLKMIEKLAQRIHEIDPSRPVFSCMEHEKYQLAGEVAAFRDAAPSIDVIGVNSYYEQQIKTLNHVFYQFDSLRPYVVSEFGPRGYWDPDYNRMSNGNVVEDSENEKAEWYEYQWKNYVQPYRGFNVGGVAYCWHDRMEGSNTWFGITDSRGRIKPSYYALKKAWTGMDAPLVPAIKITGPEICMAGSTYKFSIENISGLDVNEIEWYLRKDDYLDEAGEIEDPDKPVTDITVPLQAGSYRLYVYVSDKQDHVFTASIPIKLKNADIP